MPNHSTPVLRFLPREDSVQSLVHSTVLLVPSELFDHLAANWLEHNKVLEHVEDDRRALQELSRVMDASGFACVTVPHRMMYFAADDHFVKHFRRYEIDEMREKMEGAGLTLQYTTKALGPLEKITMYSTVMLFAILQRVGRRNVQDSPDGDWLTRLVAPIFDLLNLIYMRLAQLDAAVMPKRLATVVLFRATKQTNA